MIRHEDKIIEPDDDSLFLISPQIDLDMRPAPASGIRRLESLSINQPVKYLVVIHEHNQMPGSPWIYACIEAKRGVIAQLHRTAQQRPHEPHLAAKLRASLHPGTCLPGCPFVRLRKAGNTLVDRWR